MPIALSTWLAAHTPRWLHRPPFTTLVDAQLWVLTLVVRPATFRRMLRLHHALVVRPGIGVDLHRYGGISYLRGGREVAHLHGDGLFDAYVGSARAAALIEGRRAQVHHADGGPGWVTWDLSAARVSVGQVLAEADARLARNTDVAG